MKSSIPTIALCAIFLMLLISIDILLLNGQKIEGLEGLGLGTALGTIIGTIGGISPPQQVQHPSPQITNSPNAQVTTEAEKK